MYVYFPKTSYLKREFYIVLEFFKCAYMYILVYVCIL